VRQCDLDSMAVEGIPYDMFKGITDLIKPLPTTIDYAPLVACFMYFLGEGLIFMLKTLGPVI